MGLYLFALIMIIMNIAAFGVPSLSTGAQVDVKKAVINESLALRVGARIAFFNLDTQNRTAASIGKLNGRAI